MAKRRLIFVNRVYWPSEAATAQLLTDLTQGLSAVGHDVHVIASGCDSCTHGKITIHRTGGRERHRGPFSQAANYLGFLLQARRLIARLASPGDVVVLKSDPPLLAAWATSTALRRGAFVVQWVQDIYPEILPLHFGGAVAPVVAPLRWLRNRAWKSSAACIVPGEDMRTVVLGEHLAPEAVAVIPNWAPRECETPPNAASVLATRKRWAANSSFVVAYSGNLGRAHEFQTLLGAAAQLSPDSGIRLVIIGSGPRLPEAKATVERLGLKNVEFQPAAPRAELATSLAAADLHVVTLQPSFQRVVHPSKLYGILAAGRPALFIGPAEADLARFIASERCGWAFPTGQSQQVAGQLRELNSNRDALLAAGAAARRTYERDFTFSHALASWQQLFANLPDEPVPSALHRMGTRLG